MVSTLVKCLLLKKKADKDSIIFCSVESCRTDCKLSTMNEGYFYVYLPLKPQLECFLETKPDIDKLLAYRFEREQSADTVRDVFDGLLYKKNCPSPVQFSVAQTMFL